MPGGGKRSVWGWRVAVVTAGWLILFWTGCEQVGTVAGGGSRTPWVWVAENGYADVRSSAGRQAAMWRSAGGRVTGAVASGGPLWLAYRAFGRGRRSGGRCGCRPGTASGAAARPPPGSSLGRSASIVRPAATASRAAPRPSHAIGKADPRAGDPDLDVRPYEEDGAE
jgi:hypothetical protein